jgi:hypothetical protein
LILQTWISCFFFFFDFSIEGGGDTTTSSSADFNYLFERFDIFFLVLDGETTDTWTASVMIVVGSISWF